MMTKLRIKASSSDESLFLAQCTPEEQECMKKIKNAGWTFIFYLDEPCACFFPKTKNLWYRFNPKIWFEKRISADHEGNCILMNYFVLPDGLHNILPDDVSISKFASEAVIILRRVEKISRIVELTREEDNND